MDKRKVQVGKYAKVESLSNRVVKIRSITIAIGGTDEEFWRGVPVEREIGFIIDGQVVYTEEINMINLNFKFKPFTLDCSGCQERRSIWGTGQAYFFSTYTNLGLTTAKVRKRTITKIAGVKSPKEGWDLVKETNHKTEEQARDWLELQYVTLLAKARGLI